MDLRRKQNVKHKHSGPLTIVAISDTHQEHRKVEVPPGDLLIHAGDFTMFSQSAAAIFDFNDWLAELPHSWKIVVPGNHEFFLDAEPSRRKLIGNAIVLIDESIEIEGLRIWGSPVTPLHSGAFGKSSFLDRVKVYSGIPVDTDIIVNHGPAFGMLDQFPGSECHSGCRALLAAVQRIKPILVVCGHVHGGYGTVDTPDTLFANAALPDAGFEMSHPPLIFRIPHR